MQQAPMDRYRIVCGVDFTSATETAVREAQRLAQRIRPSELHFVHALERRAQAADRGGRGADDAEGIEHAVNRLEVYVQRVLAGVAGGFNGVPVAFHVRLEAAQPALVAVARDEQADVIIVGASERGALSQLWSRSAVLRLMRDAPAPVLVAHERGSVGSETHASSSNPDHSGVYSSLPRAPTPQDDAPWRDADSASSLCRMYEARTSSPDFLARVTPSSPPPEPRRARSGR